MSGAVNSDGTINGKGVNDTSDVNGTDVKGTEFKGFNGKSVNGISDANVAGNVVGVNMNCANGSNETSLSMDKTGKNCCRKSIILCCSYKQFDSSEFNFSKN